MEEFSFGPSFDECVCLAVDISNAKFREFREMVPESSIIRECFEFL